MIRRQNFHDLAQKWKADKINYVKRSTFAAYNLIITNHLIPSFGEMTDIKEKDVQDFTNRKLAEGLSVKSVKDMLMVLKMILKFGVRHGAFRNRTFDIRFPMEMKRADLTVLTKSEQKRLLEYVRRDKDIKSIGIYLCMSSGIRIGEMCGLRWEDIDTDRRAISIRRTVQRIYLQEGDRGHTELIVGPPKTKDSVREIPMTEDMIRMLNPLKDSFDVHSYVLTGKLKPTEPRTYRTYYNRLLKEIGIRHLKFHGLRHSFATRCIESDCDYKTVSVILGHSNISTTLNLYVHPNMNQKLRCMEKMYMSLQE